MKQVMIVTATEHKSIAGQPIDKSIAKLWGLYSPEEFDSTVVTNNHTGLSELYNSFLTEENEGKIVLFVHDDVLIDTSFLVEQLNESPFTVTGLAGTKAVNLKAEKAAWHLMSDRKDWVGEVRHTSEEKVWTTVFGPTREKALILDGLFLAVNVSRILPTGARFNEAFDWHHYDIAFGLECKKHGVSMGVMPINVIHEGLGDSMFSKTWKESNEKFKEIYSNQTFKQGEPWPLARSVM